jgi:hypothetical protein
VIQETEARAPALRPTTLLVIGMTLATLYIGALLILMPTTTYDTWGGLILGPVLLAVTLPALAHETRTQGRRNMFWLLVAALILKLVASVVQYHVAFDVYEGVADSKYYYTSGAEQADRFRALDFSGLESYTGTNFVVLLAGVLFSIIGPTRMGGFVFFSWVGFLGLFFFYRAFVTAVPEGRIRSYALLLFFLPTHLFWPSAIGKEAWMVFSLGIASLGAARVLRGRTWAGLMMAGLGVWLAALVRPHIAGLMILALAAGYLLLRPRRELKQLAPIAKLAATAALGLVALFFVARADRFLQDSGIDTGRGTTSILYQITSRTRIGGSTFQPSILESPLRAPIAVFTVVYRPLLTEAHNAQAVVAASEGTFLILLSFWRIPWALAALRSIRRQPYVGFAIAFAGLFIIAHSGIANFGQLVRHRIQLLPLYLVLLAIPPPSSWGRDRSQKDQGSS